MIASIQKSLNFEGCANPIWKDSKGIGKIATAGFVLGVLFGLHLAVVLCWVVYPVPLWLVSRAFMLRVSSPLPEYHDRRLS